MLTKLTITTKTLILIFALFCAWLLSLAVKGGNPTTIALTLATLVMSLACYVSAVILLGQRATLRFAIVGVAFGWFAEQMGSSQGWFFGRYTYTDVLGAKLLDVPMVIPLMWFALCFIAYVISNLIVLHAPTDARFKPRRVLVLSFIAAMIVTAYDLGADPYLVYTLKAWIMTKTDGWWFGETVQGFFGWVFVALTITLLFRWWTRHEALPALTPRSAKAALVPLVIYGGSMSFQICYGMPVETRSIAAFAMGIPLLCALAGWWQWRSAHDCA